MLNFDLDNINITEVDPGQTTIITAQFAQHVATRLHRIFHEATPATRRIYAGDVSAAIAEALRGLGVTQATVSVRGERWPALRVEVEG